MPESTQIFNASSKGALHQGEILSGIKQYIRIPSEGSGTAFSETLHPYCVIFSQECDLGWDFAARQNDDGRSAKLMANVLCCMAEDVGVFRNAPGINSGIFGVIKKNKNERYQYLENCPQNLDSQGNGIPSLVLDFKSYFTVPTLDLYDQIENSTVQRCRLTTPYLEQLSTRFAYFQGRIALPREHGVQTE